MDQQPAAFSSYNEHPQQRNPEPKTNGKAITALVLGILAIAVPYLGFVIGIVGIVFASMAFKEIKNTGEQGRGMAVAGLVCSIVGTALYAIILFILLIVAISFAPYS